MSEAYPEDGRRDARRKLASGARLAFPIVLGYVPIGLAYGVIAQHSGLSTAETTLMSLLVFAGSAQFIACGLLSSGASGAVIVGTTFLVNLRHVLFSASLLSRLRHLPGPLVALLAFGITDESYGVAVARLPADEPADWREVAGLNFTAYAAWVVSSSLGAALGAAIRDGSRFGTDFALPAMFICLLLMQVRGRVSAVVAVAASVLSVLVAVSPLGSWNVVVAATIAATVGALFEPSTATRAASRGPGPRR